jgi:hydrogenase nickel incorporation protein HypA/HybF
MHELSLAAEALRRCRAGLPGEPESHITRVRIAVGEFAAVDPDQLRFAWEAITALGPDADARLEIEWCQAVQVCDACGARPERTAPAWRTHCPTCGGPLRIEGGRQLDVLEFSCSQAALAESGS